MSSWSQIQTVIRRELGIWIKRPIYVVGSLLTIIFCTVFFLTFLRDGLPSDLPIGVVDMDHSTFSRNFTEQLDATQLGEIIQYDDFATARDAMQKGEITSFCLIPEHMYADIQAGRQPTMTFYVNGLYFVGGALAWKDLLTMTNLTGGAIKRQVLRAKGMNETQMAGLLRPVDIDTHQIGNMMTDYGVYLTNILLPGVLEMIVILILVYSLGAELKYGTSRHLLEKSGMSITRALAGKLIVYTVYFSVIGIIMMLILYHWMHFPLQGSLWNMVLDIILLVLASEGVAVFIIGLFPVLRFALSISAIYSVLGFSLAGFTLPVETMLPWIQGLAAAFPLRHYYLFFVQESLFGAGFAGWWPQVISLLAFLLPPLAVLPRLKNAYIYQNYAKN
jgi:ABC-2 type transport system permease protein